MEMTQKYKLSRYNVTQQVGSDVLLWNTYSGALLRLNNDAQEYLRSFSGINDYTREFSLLEDNGFIVYQHLDEYGRVCAEEKHALFNLTPSEVTFVIALGMRCNYKCGYCFLNHPQSDLTGIMTPEIAYETAEYVCAQMQNNPLLKKLTIEWFGGEPLLYTKAMEIITSKVVAYARNNNIKYAARIPTNGLYLDDNNLTLIQDLSIEAVNITLDGMSELYCSSKGATPEEFECVVSNIVRACKVLPVFVRLNIPNNNVDEAIKITDYLLLERQLLGKIKIQFAYVINYHLNSDEARQAYISYIRNYSLWLEHMVKNNRMSNIKHPQRQITHCGLIRSGNISIGPRGELYRCGHDFGRESKVIGDIWGGRFYNDIDNFYSSTIDSPIKDGCKSCSYLPVCMGPCMYHYMSGYADLDCDSFKSQQFKLKLLEGGV